MCPTAVLSLTSTDATTKNVQPTIYRTSPRSNKIHNRLFIHAWYFLMGVDLCIDKNGPIGVKLCKYEDVCPTAAHYSPSPYATTKKCTTNAISSGPPVQ